MSSFKGLTPQTVTAKYQVRNSAVVDEPEGDIDDKDLMGCEFDRENSTENMFNLISATKTKNT